MESIECKYCKSKDCDRVTRLYYFLTDATATKDKIFCHDCKRFFDITYIYKR